MCSLLLALVVGVSTVCTQAEEPAVPAATELADWLPARTLLFAEMSQPDRFMEWLAARIEQGQLANPAGLRPGSLWLRELSERLGPANLAETRVRDGLFAVTDLQAGSASWLAIIRQADQSKLVEKLRAAVGQGHWRSVRETAGITIYGAAADAQKFDMVAGPRSSLRVLALTEQEIFYGTTDAVSEALLRRAGKALGRSLREDENWRVRKETHAREQGAWFAVEMGKVMDASGLPAFLKDLVPAPAVGTLLGTMRPEGVNLEFTATLGLPGENRADATEAIPASTLATTMLPFLPKDTVAVAMSSVDGPEQFRRLLQLQGKVVRGWGWEAGDLSASVERAAAKLDVPREFARRVRQVAVAQRATPGEAGRIVLLEARSEEAADWLMDTGLTGWIQGSTDADVPPKWEPGPHASQKTLTGSAVKLHLARAGKTLILGWSSDAVHQSYEQAQQGAGLTQESVLASLFAKPAQIPGLLLACRPSRFGAANASSSNTPSVAGVLQPNLGGGPAVAVLPPPEFEQQKPVATEPSAFPLDFGPYGPLFGAGEWLALGMRHGGEQLELRLTLQPFARYVEVVELFLLGDATPLRAVLHRTEPGQPRQPGLTPKAIQVQVLPDPPSRDKR